jgi:hypothetical protein
MKLYINFNADGEKGYFSYWDGTKEVSIESFDMVVLDVRQSVTGWSESNKGRIYSNTVRTTKDTLSIKCNKKEIFSGTYAEDKAKINALGGKFQTSVFALANLDEEIVPVVLQLASSSAGSWMAFVNDNKGMDKIYNALVGVTHGPLKVKGKVKYFEPMFELKELPQMLASEADNFDVEHLKPYFNSIDSKSKPDKEDTPPFQDGD